MIATAFSESDRPPARHRGSGRGWIAMILGLILMNMAIVATTIYFATSDRSGGVEPNYYAQALNYDSVITQRATNARLGWNSIATLIDKGESSEALLTITILDREGSEVRDAVVRAEAFPSLRSSERSSLVLPQTNRGYSATVPLSARGVWRIRIRATRGADTFTSERDVPLAPTPSADAGRTGGSQP
ncbi:MAG: FixH family protein [Phycisphaerales bacterium]|nr:FixH family protein [Phycisphaerales bacterium]